MTKWRVVPISKNQLRDVNSEDLLDGGNFRLCQTYKGGGGYDQFPHIACARGLVNHPDEASRQFVVQLYGCNLDCPYCYVTRAGVWGEFKEFETRELVEAFLQAQETHGVNVFHLMGGAPGLQLPQWVELVDRLGTDVIFHSDLMLTELRYPRECLWELSRPGVLVAVNIKGTSEQQWEQNTRKPLNTVMFNVNLECLKLNMAWRNWYLTFTNVPEAAQREWSDQHGLGEQVAYGIDLINYNALEVVDSVPWGRRG